MSNPLDRPIWSALTTRQKAISHGSDRARRFPADVAPFADVGDTADLAELAALVPAGDFVVMFTGEPVEAPPGLAIVDTSSGNQMVLEFLRAPHGDFDISPLAAADVPAMQELVRLTNPGPFGPRTIELGRFVGIRRDGRLVAMAGERLKPEGHTEITGVCTHPDHRGRGYSQALVADVARHILGRGDTPFLHVYSTNKSAITLYEKLGFKFRRALRVTVLQPRDMNGRARTAATSARQMRCLKATPLELGRRSGGAALGARSGRSTPREISPSVK